MVEENLNRNYKTLKESNFYKPQPQSDLNSNDDMNMTQHMDNFKNLQIMWDIICNVMCNFGTLSDGAGCLVAPTLPCTMIAVSLENDVYCTLDTTRPVLLHITATAILYHCPRWSIAIIFTPSPVSTPDTDGWFPAHKAATQHH